MRKNIRKTAVVLGMSMLCTGVPVLPAAAAPGMEIGEAAPESEIEKERTEQEDRQQFNADEAGAIQPLSMGESQEKGTTGIVLKEELSEYNNINDDAGNYYIQSRETLNLTEEGGKDWVRLYKEGDGQDIQFERKKGGNALQINKLKDTGNYQNVTDSSVRFYWTDGQNAETGEKDRMGGAFRLEDGNAVQELGDKEVGFEIRVPAADKAQQLTFVAGTWASDNVIEIYKGDSDTPAVTARLDSGRDQPTKAKIFEVLVEANEGIRVVGRMEKINQNSGSILLMAAALDEADTQGTVTEEQMDSLLVWAKELDTQKVSGDYRNQLKAAIVQAESDKTSGFAYEALKDAGTAVENLTRESWKQPESSKKLTSVLGWEGDKDAVIAYPEGSFCIRDNTQRVDQENNFEMMTVGFNIAKDAADLDWNYVEETEGDRAGYLYPALRTSFKKDGCDVTITNFGNKVNISDKNYVAVYSRVSITNNTDTAVTMDPGASSEELVRLTYNSRVVQPGETVTHDYVVAVDRFGEQYAWPSDDDLAASGSYDENYAEMKEFWGSRLDNIVHIKSIPNEEMRRMLYATFIQYNIIKDPYMVAPGDFRYEEIGNNIHVGENGYDKVFRSDMVEMVATVINLGDLNPNDPTGVGGADIRMNLQDILNPMDPSLGQDKNPATKWKVPWMVACYLLKTGDTELVKKCFITEDTGDIDIKECAQLVVDNIEDNGLMIQTDIDHQGYWLMGNWNALLGLAAYDWICDELGYEPGSPERMLQTKDRTGTVDAMDVYKELLNNCNEKLEKVMEDSAIDYLPSNIMHANDYDSLMQDERDGNWAVHLFNGRWPWEGYLLGVDQEGVMKELIDSSYEHGLKKLQMWAPGTSDNYAGIPEGSYGSFRGPEQNGDPYYKSQSTAYNASYGASALLGSTERDAGIRALEYMLCHSFSSPYGWWESVYANTGEVPSWTPDIKGEELLNNDGHGSCPHMWGQLTALKTMMDSFISEKFDHTLIIGRGVPDEWLAEGAAPLTVDNYTVAGGKIGFTIERLNDSQVKLTVSDTREEKKGDILFELPLFQNNIKAVSTGEADAAAGSVRLPAGTAEVVVTVGEMAQPMNVADKYEAEEAELENGTRASTEHREFSGTGYVDTFRGDSQGSVTFTVNTLTDGNYTLTTRYANGDNETKRLVLYVDGEKAGYVEMPRVQQGSTGAGSVQTDVWDWWGFAENELTFEEAGEHTIQLIAEEWSGGVNVDYIRLTPEVDKFELSQAIKMAEGVLGEDNDALKKASELMEDPQASAETVDQAAENLYNAVLGGETHSELSIVEQPEDYIGSIEETAEFRVKAAGEGLTYQWEYCNEGSDKWRVSSMEGNQTDTVRVPVAKYRDGQKYRCVITDASGQKVTSEAGTVIVGQAEDAPVITRQPVSAEKLKGETAEFTVEAAGEGLTYQWQYCNAKSNIWRVSSMEGNQTPAVKVPAASYRNGQKYRCVVTGQTGRFVITETVVLTVTE